jgi:hypothetical protein
MRTFTTAIRQVTLLKTSERFAGQNKNTIISIGSAARADREDGVLGALSSLFIEYMPNRNRMSSRVSGNAYTGSGVYRVN